MSATLGRGFGAEAVAVGLSFIVMSHKMGTLVSRGGFLSGVSRKSSRMATMRVSRLTTSIVRIGCWVGYLQNL